MNGLEGAEWDSEWGAIGRRGGMSKLEEERPSNILTLPDKRPVAGVSAAQRKDRSGASKLLSVPIRPVRIVWQNVI